MIQPLANRIALVTGASRGIGFATAKALAKAGTHIVAVARTQGGLERLTAKIRKDQRTTTPVPNTLNLFSVTPLISHRCAPHPSNVRHLYTPLSAMQASSAPLLRSAISNSRPSPT